MSKIRNNYSDVYRVATNKDATILHGNSACKDITTKKARFLPDGHNGKISVTEREYHAYWDGERAEAKKKNRKTRCRNTKGVRCTKDCSTCPIFIEEGRQGSDLSLEEMREISGFEPLYDNDPSDEVCKRDLIRKLQSVLSALNEADRLIASVMEKERDYKKVMEILHLTLEQYKYKKKLLKDFIRDELKDYV